VGVNTIFDPSCLQVNDPIKASPVGAGVLTDITEAGYPRVDRVAVAWCIRTDGSTFDPYGHTRKPDFKEEDWYEKR
jgi:hypothetical protein